MTHAHRTFLDNNRFFVESYSQEMPPRMMSYKDRVTLLQIVREYFDPTHTADLWCQECCKAFILNAYLMYDQYEKGK